MGTDINNVAADSDHNGSAIDTTTLPVTAAVAEKQRKTRVKASELPDATPETTDELAFYVTLQSIAGDLATADSISNTARAILERMIADDRIADTRADTEITIADLYEKSGRAGYGVSKRKGAETKRTRAHRENRDNARERFAAWCLDNGAAHRVPHSFRYMMAVRLVNATEAKLLEAFKGLAAAGVETLDLGDGNVRNVAAEVVHYTRSNIITQRAAAQGAPLAVETVTATTDATVTGTASAAVAVKSGSK